MTLEVVQSTILYTRLGKQLTLLMSKKLNFFLVQTPHLTLKSTQTKSFVNIRHLSLLEISPAEALSSTMPRKAWRACMAALKSLTTKSQTNDPLPPLFAPILLTECWA
jgi:hypothetical protein